jgi:hypothetical protein
MMVFAVTISKAQTKQQTIDWLKEKLSKYVVNDEVYKNALSGSWTIQEVVINECEILFKCSHWWGFSGGTTDYYDIVMPTQDLTITSDACFALNYEGMKETSTGTTYRDKSGLNRTFNFKNTNNRFRINYQAEVNIIERIQKAITHLAEFCPPKPKEAF